MQNFQRVGKNFGPILSRLWTKVHVVLGRCRIPFVIVNAQPIVYIVFRCEDIGRQIAGIKLRTRPKRWFWAPDLEGEGILQILDVRYQIAVTSEHVAYFG